MNCRGSVMQDRTGEPPAVMIAPSTAQGQQQPPCGDPFRRTKPTVCWIPKPPFGKGRCHGGCRDGGIVTGSLVLLTLHDVNPSVKNRRFLPAPLTQGSLWEQPLMVSRHGGFCSDSCRFQRQLLREVFGGFAKRLPNCSINILANTTEILIDHIIWNADDGQSIPAQKPGSFVIFLCIDRFIVLGSV